MIRAIFGKKESLCLAPITPFTPIQKTILELLFIERMTHEEVARQLDITRKSLEDRIWGNGIFTAQNTDKTCFWRRREFLGISAIIEITKGVRPRNLNEIEKALLGDVLLENYDPETGEFYRMIHRPSEFGTQYF